MLSLTGLKVAAEKATQNGARAWTASREQSGGTGSASRRRGEERRAFKESGRCSNMAAMRAQKTPIKHAAARATRSRPTSSELPSPRYLTTTRRGESGRPEDGRGEPARAGRVQSRAELSRAAHFHTMRAPAATTGSPLHLTQGCSLSYFSVFSSAQGRRRHTQNTAPCRGSAGSRSAVAASTFRTPPSSLELFHFIHWFRKSAAFFTTARFNGNS